MKNLICILFCVFFISVQALTAQVATPVAYPQAVVTTADERATQAGIEILQMGGNAVDAAIAVQFALAVTLPRAGNIGGGGFMVLRLQNGDIKALDFREKAPASASRNMFLNDEGIYIPEKSRVGGLASGVPGTVDGMISALERHGTLPLEVIMEPAIRMARNGFRLSYSHAASLNQHREKLEQFEASKEIFIQSDGKHWKEGDLFVQHDLAETLERIARRGRDGFYSGLTARLLIREVQIQGGVMTLRDLRNYSSVWRQPTQFSYSGYEIYTMPPPSSGGIVMQQVLTMTGKIDPANTGVNSSAYIHLLSEALKRSFADRNYYLGDPDAVEMPVETLLSESYLTDRFAGFDSLKATPGDQIEHGSIQIFAEPDETTHFSVADRHGNAVAVTTTLNGSYGSYLTIGGAGFLMNNEMDDLSAKPGEPNMFGLIGAEANAIESGKRMLSSMSPTIITRNGKLKMVAGGSGGPTIISATLQNMLNVILYGMDVNQAISFPRFHHQWLPDQIVLERLVFPNDVTRKLSVMGHSIRETHSLARTHLIVIDDEGNKTGAADPRGDGKVMGY